MLALDWLIRNQAADGSWEAEDGESKVGVTSIALLAFLGAGFTTWAQEDCAAWGCRSGPTPAYRGPPYAHHRAIRQAVGFLIRSQDADGFIGHRGSPLSLRDHALAAQALSEACGSSQLRSLVEVAERAIQAMEIDEAAIGWTALALRSAALWRVPFSRSLDEIRRHVPSIQPLLERLPSWKPGEIDPHAWYWGTMALFRYDGREGPAWKKWNTALKEALLRGQETQGSWAPPGRARAESTALFCLTLTIQDQATVFYGPEK